VFPKNPKEYDGYLFVRIIAFLYLVAIVVRSSIHLFAPDGGAESIAGIDTSGPGGNNVIAIFHQWGAIQLLLVGVLLTLFFVYRGFTPLVLLAVCFDAPLRALGGLMSDFETSRTPPGEALNWPVFWFLVVLFIASLLKKKTAPSH
jgi:hypothetical protein